MHSHLQRLPLTAAACGLERESDWVSAKQVGNYLENLQAIKIECEKQIITEIVMN